MMVESMVMQATPMSPVIFYVPGVTLLTLVDDFLIAMNTARIKGEIWARFNLKDLSTPTLNISL